MHNRPTESKRQDKMEITEQKNGSQQNFFPLIDFLSNDIWLVISVFLSSKEIARLASVKRQLYGLFQSKIGEKEVKEAAECAIYPTEENVKKLKTLLNACPALLRHQVTVKNRHDIPIKGTVHQITLHEGDNELIDDVIKPAFERLHRGLETMEAQCQEWLPKGWMEEEERACASALTAIDHVFTAFKNASHPNDVTELPQYPYTITINNQEVSNALDAFRKAIDALYKPTGKVIESGRDPSVRLIERFIDRYKENYDALGGDGSPRNNALIRAGFGYCQRSAPINFMQAFVMGVYSIVKDKEKLIRTFEYRNWKGHFILPQDSDPHFRLGYEYYVAAWHAVPGRVAGAAGEFTKLFVNQKQQLYKTRIMCNSTQDDEPIEPVEQVPSWKKYCAIM